MTEAPVSTPIPEPPSALHRRWSWVGFQESGIQGLLFVCAVISVVTTISIIAVLLYESWLFFSAEQVTVTEFLTNTQWSPTEKNPERQHFGIWPLLAGTLMLTGIAGVIGLPLGLLSALYLSEYATPRARSIFKPTLEILAGIPSIVYGFVGLVFVTPYLLRPLFQDFPVWLGFKEGLPVGIYNILSAGLVVGIMIVPTVASLSEDVLRSVPRGLREAGLALGATKYEVSVKVILPAALSGILAAFLLALSRAIGETMAVAIAAGTKSQFSFNVLDSVQTMTGFIATVIRGEEAADSIAYKSLYAVALSLFAITLIMNQISQYILQRYRNVYQ